MLIKERLSMTDSFTDGQMLDWLERNPSVSHESGSDEHCITAWVIQGEPGNECGTSGRFYAAAKTFRGCIAKFLRGEIMRMD